MNESPETADLRVRAARAMGWKPDSPWWRHQDDEYDLGPPDPTKSPHALEALEAAAWGMGIRCEIQLDDDRVIVDAWDEGQSAITTGASDHDGSAADMLRAKKQAIVTALVEAMESRKETR